MTDGKIPESFKNGFINELVRLKVLDKQVREYSGRKRINITNTDGLVKDDAVVVLKKSDYDDLMTELYRLEELEKDMNNQKVTADAIGDKFIKPLQDSYDIIISELQEQIKDKDTEINRLKAVYQEYDKQVYSMGFMDILRHKNREISDDFNSKIWITRPDSMVTDAEVRKLNEPADSDDHVETGDSNGGADSE